jgi:hypothetical protein
MSRELSEQNPEGRYRTESRSAANGANKFAAAAKRVRLCQNSKNRNDTAIYSVIKPYNKENNAIYGSDNDF